MKKYLFLFLSILIIEIYSNPDANNNNIPPNENNNSNSINPNPQQNNTQPEKPQDTKDNQQQINQSNNNNQPNNNNTQNNINNNTQQNQNNSIYNNSADSQNKEIPKKDEGRGVKKDNKTEEEKNLEEKAFNLTESLIKFFKETFGNNEEKDKDKNKDKDKEKDKDKDKDKEDNEKSKEYIEEMKRRKEAEMIRREMQEREKKRREEFEARAKAELIKIENQMKEEKKKKEQEERAKFESQIQNTTFEEFIQISLEKGESEILYLDLDSFSKVKMALILTDEEEKVNFVLSGPNARGRTSVLYKVDNKNYLFYEYESLRKGEYTIEITNKGSKENELIFLFNEHVDKKKDLINTEKIDKISMLLNNIDNNVNQLKNKKKIEIRQMNSHNEKVDKNNRNIVIYSIIEIFTMIIVFIAQSYYISSIVTKL